MSSVHFLEPLLRKQVQGMALFVEGQDTPLATVLETAFDSTARKKGLLGRDGLDEATALVIAPCSAVHTFAMRFPIDVIFARREGSILKLRRQLPATRVTGALGAFAVIEMAAGSIDRAGLRVGQRLLVR